MFVSDRGRWTKHLESTYVIGSLAGLARVSLGLGGGGLLDRCLLGSGSLCDSSLLGGNLGSRGLFTISREHRILP